jgi:hypothetical protein
MIRIYNTITKLITVDQHPTKLKPCVLYVKKNTPANYQIEYFGLISFYKNHKPSNMYFNDTDGKLLNSLKKKLPIKLNFVEPTPTFQSNEFGLDKLTTLLFFSVPNLTIKYNNRYNKKFNTILVQLHYFSINLYENNKKYKEIILFT